MTATATLTIGIDARLVRYRRGIGNFVFHVVGALLRRGGGHRFIVYVDEAASIAKLPDGATVRVLRPRPYALFEQLALPRAADRDRLDVLYCPANSAPVRLGGRTRLVMTLHDVMYLAWPDRIPRSPSFYQRIGRRYLRIVVPAAARRAAQLTTVSRRSAADAAAALGLPAAGIRVVHEAAGSAFRPLPEGEPAVQRTLARYGVRQPYVLAFGALDPRKNTQRVLEAFARLQVDLPAAQLVLCSAADGVRETLARSAARLGIQGRVVFPGFVGEPDLVHFYNGALMLLYPSLYEGFGVPVLEAMACGTSVVTSNAGAIPEVAGDAALVADAGDSDAIAAAMIRLAGDEALRHDLRERGLRRAAEFDWARTAVTLLEVFEHAAAGAGAVR